MKIMIEVGVGDFIDRLSILEIKLNHGLDVADEINQYTELVGQFDEIGFDHYKSLFLSINTRLWILEDQKRKFTARDTSEYANVSELITQLNDIRFAIKKKTDAYFKSPLSEKKSHG
jgi:hypothetical protein